MTPEEFKALEAQAQTGDPQAMFELAIAYITGDGVEPNPEQYFHWTKRAAEADEPKAMFNLALAYHDGTGTPPDSTQFFNWTKRAAEAGDLDAMFQLALIYFGGTVAPPDPAQFFYWTKQAADKGDPKAMFNLALAYLKGAGTEADPTQYFYWIQQAADKGDPKAMFNLAVAYKKGTDTDADLTKYFHWMRQAAEAGISEAMLNLALAYLDGTDTPRDMTQYDYWIKRAADIGEPRAMISLALAYKFGLNGEENPVQFTYWLKKALAHDHVDAMVLERIQNIDRTHLKRIYPLLKNLSETVAQIKSRHLLTDCLEVAHFTRYDTLEKMLPILNGKEAAPANTHFRLYNIKYLNDPDEGQVLFQHLQKSDPALHEKLFDGLADESRIQYYDEQVSVYTCSFSSETDRLDLWRAYGNDGDGVSIVTPSGAFDRPDNQHKPLAGLAYSRELALSDNAPNGSEAEVPLVLYKVCYNEKEFRQSIRELRPTLKKLSNYKTTLSSPQFECVREAVRMLLCDIQFLYKNKEYENEKELRLIYTASIHSNILHMDERTPGRLYVKTRPLAFEHPKSRVVIGPKVKEKTVAELNCKFRLARHGKLKNTEVVQSTIHYR